MKNSKNSVNIFSVKIVVIFALLIIAVVLSFIIPKMSFVFLIIAILICGLGIYLSLTEIKDRKRRIEELSISVSKSLESSLENFDLPLAIVKLPSSIVWQNKNCSHIIPKDMILDSALNLEKQGLNKKIDIDIGNGETYTSFANSIRYKDEDALLVGFVNKTEEEKLKLLLDDTKVAVGIVFLDNYEETMQGLDEIKKAEISSEITKILVDFASKNKGIVTKIDKDKYVLLVEKQYIKVMEKESFDILERIKEVSQDTKLIVTMSLGMSYLESTLDERYKSATSALDIALGRGGDQIVIKKDKKFDFYGGTNIGIEKTSRVRARTIAQAIKDTIEKADEIYIMGHKNTDIDCIGASIGVAKVAMTLGKRAHIVIDTKCNNSTKAVIEKIKEDTNYQNVFITKDELKSLAINSVLFVVDTHKKSYTVYPDLIDEFEKVIVIDHHRRGTEFIEDAFLTYHEIYASSASELVSEILMYLDEIELTSAEAQAIYAGIVVDTKNFMFKTGVRTFEVAAYLKKFGIDFTEVKQIFQSDLTTYSLRSDIVKSAEIINEKIAISETEEVYEEMPIIAAQAADELLSITGVIASFVLCKVDDVIMISGRSMGDINVQAILEKIGGGGHLTFAGAQIAGISMEKAKKKLLDSINEYFEN